MNDQPPRISVIVPSYNKPEYLPECLKSIQDQTFTNWECIVVSDGSPHVEEIRLTVAAMRDSRFRLVRHQENRGLAAARNTGVREAQSDLVLCVDEDDKLECRALRILLDEMSNTEADVVVPGFRYFGENRGEKIPRLPNDHSYLSEQRLLGAGFLIRKKLWMKLGGNDESEEMRNSREDFEFWIRILTSQASVHVCQDILYLYRREDLARSMEVNKRLFEVRSRQVIVKKHTDLYMANPQQYRIFMSAGYEVEARARWAKGDRFLATRRAGTAFVLMPSWKRLRTFLRFAALTVLRRNSLR